MASYVFRNSVVNLTEDSRVHIQGDLVFVADDGTETTVFEGLEGEVDLAPIQDMAAVIRAQLRAKAEYDWFHKRNNTLTTIRDGLADWSLDPEQEFS